MSYTSYQYPPDRTAIEIELEASHLQRRLAQHHARDPNEAQQIILQFSRDLIAFSSIILFSFGFPFLLLALKTL